MVSVERAPGAGDIALAVPGSIEIPRSPGVYTWWLDSSRLPAPRDAGRCGLPHAGEYLHPVEGARLLYVGRARRNLQQRIIGQHLHRTRSSALRRTLLAVLFPGHRQWVEGAYRDARGRLCLEQEAEDRLTGWMRGHLRLGWVGLESAGTVDTVEQAWIAACQPPLNTAGTAHRQILVELKRDFLAALDDNAEKLPLTHSRRESR